MSSPRDFRSLDGGQQQLIAAARREFAASVARGDVKVLDRFGSAIQVGDMVLYKPEIDYVMDVVGVSANLHPQAPVGAVGVTVTVTATINVMVGRSLPNLIKVGKKMGEHTDLTGPVITEDGAAPDPVTAELRGALAELLAEGGPLGDPVSRSAAKKRARAALGLPEDDSDGRD